MHGRAPLALSGQGAFVLDSKQWHGEFQVKTGEPKTKPRRPHPGLKTGSAFVALFSYSTLGAGDVNFSILPSRSVVLKGEWAANMFDPFAPPGA